MSNQNTTVTIREGRLSYAHIWHPQASQDEGGEPSYNTAVLIAKDNAKDIDAIKAAIEAARKQGVEKFGSKWKPSRLPLRDGDVDKSEDAAYEDHFFFNCKSKIRPGIVNRKLQPIIDESEVYSGCYCMVAVNFYPYSHPKGGTGIAAGLRHICKLRDGEALSASGEKAEDVFKSAIEELDDIL